MKMDKIGKKKIRKANIKAAKIESIKRRKRKISDDFYTSDEWYKLRYRALKKYGTYCMKCGKGREDGVVIAVDHIKPRSIYPSLALDFSNLQVLCRPCDKEKGRDEIDYRPIEAKIALEMIRLSKIEGEG